MSKDNKIQLTSNGLAQIKDELSELKNTKVNLAVERVARARDFGDLSENSEYHSAREELSFIEGRIEELENIVNNATIISSSNNGNGKIDIGCRVTVEINGNEQTFELVGEWEANPMEKRISHTSPLGQALMGKKKNEEVELEVPAGKVIYKIKQIH